METGESSFVRMVVLWVVDVSGQESAPGKGRVRRGCVKSWGSLSSRKTQGAAFPRAGVFIL